MTMISLWMPRRWRNGRRLSIGSSGNHHAKRYDQYENCQYTVTNYLKHGYDHYKIRVSGIPSG